MKDNFQIKLQHHPTMKNFVIVSYMKLNRRLLQVLTDIFLVRFYLCGPSAFRIKELKIT